MQSSLKKSLYLGLAALSFASVASVTANSSNANAAKKHAAAKKVTYKTTDSKLDQSVVFKSTGKNAVYNKAVGKRSVVASLSDMKSKANSNSTKDLFMAYQEGVTSKGVHYYKVVSFDKKVRGFVYNKGVAKTNTTVAADKPANATGYLTTTSRFFNKPYGSQFKTSVKNDYNGMNIAADQFTVSDSVKVNNDQTYYYVKDTKNELVNGWVNSVYFSNTITDAAKKATNSANAIHVNFVDNANLGSVLFTKDLNPNNLSQSGIYNKSDVQSAVDNALRGTGYTYNGGVQDTAKGNTLTVTVNAGKAIQLTPANFIANSVSNEGTGNQTTTTNDSNVHDQMNKLTLTPDQWKSIFGGKQNQSFDFNGFENSLLSSGKAWNTFTVTNNGTTMTYTYNPTFTKNDQHNKDLMNKGLTFDDIQSGNFNIYYDAKNTTNSNNTNGSGAISNDAYTKLQNQKKALSQYMSDKGLTSSAAKDQINKANAAATFASAATKDGNAKGALTNADSVITNFTDLSSVSGGNNAPISSIPSTEEGTTDKENSTNEFIKLANNFNAIQGNDNYKALANVSADTVNGLN